MKKFIFLIATLIFSFNVSAALVVIGNTSGVDSLTTKDAKKLFMGKKTKLSNGSKAKIVELTDGNAQRIAFHGAVTGRSESQLQSAWARLVFTGKAEAPIQVTDDAAVITAVSADPNAIGYVDESQVTDAVKVLLKL
jgi:ABC-type phosphate transport system substrate-binding protein